MITPFKPAVPISFLWLCLAACSGSSSAPHSVGDHGQTKDAATPPDARADAQVIDGNSVAVDGAGMGFGSPDAAIGMGGACTVNADCTNSPAADALKNVRCAGAELYCLLGQCYADCMEKCDVVRTDVNPCPSPRICEPRLGGSVSFCAMIPARCQSTAECPTYLPPTDGGTGAWSCDDSLCSYPGYDFPTR